MHFILHLLVATNFRRGPKTTLPQIARDKPRDLGVQVWTVEREYEYLQVRGNEEGRISQLVVGFLWDLRGSGGGIEIPIFTRQRVEATSTRGTGYMLSAAIAYGLVSGSTNSFSPLFAISKADRHCLAPEAARNGATYT